MNKIVPILTLLLAVATIILNIAAIICAGLSHSVAQIRLIAIPTSIVGLAMAGLLTPFAYFFKKAILCKISFYIDIASLIVAIAAVAVAFTAA